MDHGAGVEIRDLILIQIGANKERRRQFIVYLDDLSYQQSMSNTDSQDQGELRAPMSGKVLEIRADAGQEVIKGDILMILEAMKLEHRLLAPSSGSVKDIFVTVGDQVQSGERLISIDQK